MKEIFDRLDRVDLHQKRLILLDTCFVIHVLQHGSVLLSGFQYAFTSFNVHEILRVSHHLHNLKVPLRHLVKTHTFLVVDTPVSPGEWQKERAFVHGVDAELLQSALDPSDAVLLAVGILTHSVILTKDKHHLFTSHAQNHIQKYDLRIYKELKDLNLLPKNWIREHRQAWRV